MKHDTRHKQIGGKHRAETRYAMLLNRVRALTEKNKCYKGIEVNINRGAFVEWFMEKDFEGCSVDRIDNTKNYEWGNLQLIPKGYNAAKDKIVAHDGKSRCYRCKVEKPISMFVKETRRKTVGLSTICLACERQRTRERKISKRYNDLDMAA